jgi:Phasin protein
LIGANDLGSDGTDLKVNRLVFESLIFRLGSSSGAEKMSQQDPRVSPASGMDEAVATLAATTKNFQAFASEVAEISKQSYEHATQTLEKLRNAHGVEEVVAIQTTYVKEALEHAGQYTKKFSELMATFPLGIGKSYQEAWLKSINSAIQTSEAASQSIAANVERFSESVKKP